MHLERNFDFTCDDQHCLSETKCEDLRALGSLVMNIEEHEKTLNVEGLLTQVEETKCRFNGFDSGDRMILGNPFMQEYYTVIDIDHEKIGLGQLEQEVEVEPLEPEPAQN